MKILTMVALTRSAALLAAAALAGSNRWTESKYGPDDLAGASNLVTPAKAMEAVALMKTVAVLSIGRTYETAMPLVGARPSSLRRTGDLTGGSVFEFSYIFSPMPIKGATGSAGAPLAAS